MLPILFAIEGGIATITLNRPDKLNSFNREMALLLQQKLDECASLHTVRCVYITGAGKGFCAGQDLAEVVDPQGPDKGKHRVQRGGSWDFRPEFCRSAFRFRSLPGFASDNCGFRLCFFVD